MQIAIAAVAVVAHAGVQLLQVVRTVRCCAAAVAAVAAVAAGPMRCAARSAGAVGRRCFRPQVRQQGVFRRWIQHCACVHVRSSIGWRVFAKCFSHASCDDDALANSYVSLDCLMLMHKTYGSIERGSR